MNRIDSDRLMNVLLESTGPQSERLRSHASRESLLATILVDAHSEDAQSDAIRCPVRAKRRAESIFESQPLGIWQSIASLAFDSWHALAPASRSMGIARLLRFEHQLASIDVEVTHASSGREVTIVLAVEGLDDAPRARILVGDARSEVWVSLDEDGTGSTTIDLRELDLSSMKRAATAIVVIEDELGEVMRTPALELM